MPHSGTHSATYLAVNVTYSGNINDAGVDVFENLFEYDRLYRMIDITQDDQWERANTWFIGRPNWKTIASGA